MAKTVSVRFSASGGKEVQSEAQGIRLAIGGVTQEVNRQAKDAQASASVFSEAIEREAASFDALRRSLDPAYAAQMKFVEGAESVERAVFQGIASEKEAASTLALLEQRYLGVTKAAVEAATAIQRQIGATAGIGMGIGSGSAQASAGVFEEAAREAAAVDRLRQSLDSGYAATKRFEEAQESLQRAVAIGAITQDQANVILGQAQEKMLAATGAIGATGRSMQGARVDAANLGYQFNDVFVMLASGQSPLMLAVQQGSQISQILGPMGAQGAVAALKSAFLSLVNPLTAITIGTIAGGAALIQWLMGAGEEAEDLSDGMDELRASLRRYKAAADDARASAQDLGDRFGYVDQRTRELLRTIADAEEVSFLKSMTEQADALGASLGIIESLGPEVQAALAGTGSLRDTGSQYLARTYLEGLDALAVRLKVSDEAAEELYARLQTLMQAEGPTELINAAQTLHDRMVEAGVAITDNVLVGLREMILAMKEVRGKAELIANIDPRREAIESQAGIRRYGQEQIGDAINQGILDLIAAVEGTSNRPAGGYNTSLDFGRWLPGGQEQMLTAMTLREIRELQDFMRSNPENRDRYRNAQGEPVGSSAVGRYQIVSSTLDGLIQQLGLSMNELFTPALQDRLAAELVRQAGGPNGIRGTWDGFNNGAGAGVSDAEINRALAGSTEVVDAAVEAEERLAEGRRNNLESARDFIASQRSAMESVDQLRASFDPAAERLLEFAEAQATVDQAIRAGTMSATEGAAFMEEFTAAYDAEATQEQADKLEALQGRLDQFRGSLDPATQATLEYAEAEKTLTEAVNAGIISATERQRMLDQLTMQQIMDTDAMKDLIARQEAAAEEIKGVWDGATQSMADFFASGIVDGFDDGMKGAIQILKDGLRKMLSIALRNRIFIPTQTGIQAGMSGGALPGAGPGSGILGSIGSGLGGIIGGFSTGFGNVFSGFMSGGFGGAFGAIGSALSGATAGLGGLATAIGAIAAPIAAVVGIFAAFRKNTELLDAGLRFTVKGLESVIQTFETTETTRLFGLLSNTDTDFDTMKKDEARPIRDAYRAVYDSVTDLGAILGASALRLKNFSAEFQVSLEGMTDAEKARAIEAEFAKISDQMATQLVPTIKEFAKLGERATETLQRVATAFAGANQAMDLLDKSLFKTGEAGIKAANAFVEAFGSVEGMAQSVNAYFQGFYSPEEQLAEARETFREGFRDLFPTRDLPKTKEQFKAIVDALMEAGRTKAAGSLIALSDEFLTLLGLQEQVAQGQVDAAKPELSGYWTQIWTLQGKLNLVRKEELKGLTEAEKALQIRIWALEDEAKLTAQRENLEQRYLELTGNVDELRRRELEALDASLRPLQQMIWGIEDAQKAFASLNASDFASQVDYFRAAAKVANKASAPGSNVVSLPLATVSATRQNSPEIVALRQETKSLRQDVQDLRFILNRVAMAVEKQARQTEQWVDGDPRPVQVVGTVKVVGK